MRRLCALAAVAVVLAGCGGGRHVRMLHMASADPVGIEHDPAVEFFVDRVAQLSRGHLRIAVDERWAPGATAHEPALLRDVARGRADVGWAHASSFDRVGVRSFQVLQAPLLIDRDSVEDAVIRSPLAADLLAGVRSAGLQGLALLAGPMSRLVGANQPVRDADDLRGLAFAVRDSSLADSAVHALHGYSERMTATTIGLLYADGEGRPARPTALEDDLDSLFFDRYGGPCDGPSAACGSLGPWVTTNVVLWPRPAVLVANPRWLRSLTRQQRAWVTDAAAQAARYATTRPDEDARLLRELCAAGVRFTTAPPDAIASLRRAWRPVYRRMRARPDARAALLNITRLRDMAPAASSLRPPTPCEARPPDGNAARGVRSALPDGTYRTQLTDTDLRAAGANGSADRPGTATLTLRSGQWQLVLTEPGRTVHRGTYAGTPLRIAWATSGHGRDETYLSVAVGRDGALRFHVAWSQNLPSNQAIYASHPWRRIGG